MMRLHNYFRSSTSYRIRIALALKGLDYEYVPVNLAMGEQFTDSFDELNAFHSLPVLEDDDNRMVQSLAILDWLEEQYPEPSLWPTNGDDRQVCRELYYAIATEIHAPNNLSVLNHLKREFGADQAMLEAWNQTWISRTFTAIEDRLSKHNWRSDGLPFGHPTVFEIVLIPQLYNAKRWKLDLGAFQNMLRVEEYCLNLDAFQKAHPSNQIDAPEEKA